MGVAMTLGVSAVLLLGKAQEEAKAASKESKRPIEMTFFASQTTGVQQTKNSEQNTSESSKKTSILSRWFSR